MTELGPSERPIAWYVEQAIAVAAASRARGDNVEASKHEKIVKDIVLVGLERDLHDQPNAFLLKHFVDKYEGSLSPQAKVALTSVHKVMVAVETIGKYGGADSRRMLVRWPHTGTYALFQLPDHPHDTLIAESSLDTKEAVLNFVVGIRTKALLAASHEVVSGLITLVDGHFMINELEAYKPDFSLRSPTTPQPEVVVGELAIQHLAASDTQGAIAARSILAYLR